MFDVSQSQQNIKACTLRYSTKIPSGFKAVATSKPQFAFEKRQMFILKSKITDVTVN